MWPLIRLAGEDTSKGKSKEEHKLQSVSYLHYLLLARPDLHVSSNLYWRTSLRLTCLKVLRFLCLEWRILHRDISKGNILHIEQPLSHVGPTPAKKGTQGVNLLY
jgi:hypothetical protein